MNKYDIDKAYISPDDLFLRRFDATHPLTASQEREIQKHDRIADLRDNPRPEKPGAPIWDAF